MKLKTMIVIGIIVLAIVAVCDLNRNGMGIFESYAKAFDQNFEDKSTVNNKVFEEKSGDISIQANKISAIIIETDFRNVSVRGAKDAKSIGIHYTLGASEYSKTEMLKILNQVKISYKQNDGGMKIFIDYGEQFPRYDFYMDIEILVPPEITSLKLLPDNYSKTVINDFPGQVDIDRYMGEIELNHVGSVIGHVMNSEVIINNK